MAGDDGPLLDGAGLLEPVGVDATQQLLLQLHVVKVLAHLQTIEILIFLFKSRIPQGYFTIC